jgi:fructuronate reductase
LPNAIIRPGYDRTGVRPGIVHIGVGAFNRAHQAVYTDDLLAEDPGWGILGASLRGRETRDALAPQDGLYTLSVRSGTGERLRVIGAIRSVLVAPDDPGAMLTAMSDPRIRIVSLTITEKGYCHDPATGELNEAHPDILHDLAASDAPRSAIGFIVEALRRRRSSGVAPFTVLTCDNLPANGRVAKRVLDRFAALRDRDLGAYVEGELVCPSTMVDRITPGDHRRGQGAHLGRARS